MSRKKLTNSTVEAFVCRTYRDGKRAGQCKEQDVLWCGELKGFGMRLSAKTGTRTYIFQYRVKGKANSERTITIGRHNDPYRVDDARRFALELKAKMLGGVDPIEEAQRKREAEAARAALNVATSMTLKEALESYRLPKSSGCRAVAPARDQHS